MEQTVQLEGWFIDRVNIDAREERADITGIKDEDSELSEVKVLILHKPIRKDCVSIILQFPYMREQA